MSLGKMAKTTYVFCFSGVFFDRLKKDKGEGSPAVAF